MNKGLTFRKRFLVGLCVRPSIQRIFLRVKVNIILDIIKYFVSKTAVPHHFFRYPFPFRPVSRRAGVNSS